MTILYLTEGKFPDYQSDMILHGLRTSDFDVIDYPQPWYMYKNLKEKYWNELIPLNGKGYGKGFTISGTLDDINIDRENIEEKISQHFFDIIIYGSCRRSLQFFDLVKKEYNKKEIIFIDGEDHSEICLELAKIGLYFKRELVNFNKQIFPIEFCIPEEKIFLGEVKKTIEFAKIVPGKQSTYIYDNEEDYYNGYREAKFGVTMKKAGWDCLRHYEIIANKCLPNFIDIDNCPERTMTFFPKKICKEINQDIKNKTMYNEKYFSYLDEITKHLKENLTTKKMIKYLLEKL
jgi:hypothetical protein